MANQVIPHSLFSEFDVALFQAGRHFKLYEKFGSHELEVEGERGVYFAVWAPNAKSVSVTGNFNFWDKGSHPLNVRWDTSGIWEGFIPGIANGETYKYCIQTSSGEELEKGDPFAFRWEVAPKTASIVHSTWYEWNDGNWMKERIVNNRLDQPWSVYELHLGSWVRDPESPETLLNYREIAVQLVAYVKEMNFTHVEFMPLMEHPYYPSWGYQITGYFAASSRYGSAQDLMFLIDELHAAGIGVLLDWVPSHFPGDAHGLFRFDGTSLYEHEDPRKGFHPDWQSYIFNYGRNEVRSFLISNAFYWLDRFHIDGLRVDAVASMLYLDYSRNAGEWIPNEFGGNENLEAVHFLKEFNEAVYAHFPDVQTIAEESTSWPGVSKPTYAGGLGFGMKWMMGWMHDTLDYFKEDPINRKYHHDRITFATVYAFHENFMLPLSHDEVVYGKQPLIYKMPGDEWQKFANLRALYLFMYTFSGTKLLFMGGEFGQTSEWNVNQSLDWHLLEFMPHQGMKKFVADLNATYRQQPSLFQKAFDASGFEWIDAGDRENSVLVYWRKAFDSWDDTVIVINLTPVVREDFRIGLPYAGEWEVVLSSDDLHYFGSGICSQHVASEQLHWMNRAQSAQVDLPPLGGYILKRKQDRKESTPVKSAERVPV
ncbi:1,4-alpha-glucan branching protein GlgB [Sphingobacterium sp. DR205]|uniref:1,4-alpha-glucan branching protein GlgB n=1 Tax=Sphingobacterium sp. DR205 TaxID=2713573 RepID=UPI0013E52039|nr:1,4-alpha-glucan branching protein GlgB [Sphingobacterium sp. DR205]QIH34984.1 1,4-alpha-glucan branching protein GlgB [Sphingobacterium sp. DR205]